MIGTYEQREGKTYPHITYSSLPASDMGIVVLTEIVKDGRLYISGTKTFSDGKKSAWEDIFEKQ
jgi:hypothetical protein